MIAMLTRTARIRELTRRVFEDGSVAHSALVSWDEAACTSVRLTPTEFGTLETCLAKRRRLVMTLTVGPEAQASAADGDAA